MDVMWRKGEVVAFGESGCKVDGSAVRTGGEGSLGGWNDALQRSSLVEQQVFVSRKKMLRESMRETVQVVFVVGRCGMRATYHVPSDSSSSLNQTVPIADIRLKALGIDRQQHAWNDIVFLAERVSRVRGTIAGLYGASIGTNEDVSKVLWRSIAERM